ncbi:MAG: hypothetical protein JSW42_09445 [Chloroflexota bacterium]|nr:MAG: hypothetical protein JSW42_09445 [Chloroflexota bacterium]
MRFRAVDQLPIDFDEDDYLLAGQHYAQAIREENWGEIINYEYPALPGRGWHCIGEAGILFPYPVCQDKANGWRVFGPRRKTIRLRRSLKAAGYLWR